MANIVKIKRSSVASNVPTTGQLVLGELAINTYDGKLYLKKNVASVESIVEVGPLNNTPLTGVPTAPTAVAGTNTSQLATTAHVFAERTNTATLTNKTLIASTLGVAATDTHVVNGSIAITNNSSTVSTTKCTNLAVTGAVAGDTTLLLSTVSSVSNALYSNTWAMRDAAGADWNTAKIHDGLGVDGSFLVPGSTTRCWYERHPNRQEHKWGSSATTYATLNSTGLTLTGTLTATTVTGNMDFGTI